MATQSLYRRYRPRRFSELRGQEHIVRALRTAVINNREGQAYLFSGPRGTGKTTSARILAKVLNCERAVDGEPCCECESCLAVERGTSYDVHELDAASNNGVEAIRSIIEKSALGTPGRHRVYILDEVHMLTKGAEAALLKTLEEPPPHVVFVLATTDPQKVSDTIRSRTQHLRFHLLPMEELEEHVRWVVQDAGLEVSDAAIQSVLEQGGGSARDTLSALELVASAGGDEVDAVQYGEFVEALIEHDPGRALTAAAFAVQQGRDPRGVTEDLVRHLRDCFLSLMAPELVALPDAKATTVAEQAARLGAARVVRAMERLGEMLVEMRHAPDPRLLLEVALVQLTHEPAANDMHTLMTRLERLEQAVESGGAGAGAAPQAPAVAAPKVDPATGRVQLGGGARRGPAGAPPPSASAPAPVSTQRARVAPAPAPAAPAPPAPSAPAPAPAPAPAAAPPAPAAPAASPPGPAPAAPAPAAAAPAPVPPAASAPAAPAGAAASGVAPAQRAAEVWTSEVVPTLKPLVRAIYSVPRVLGGREGALVLGAPNEAHRRRCEEHLRDVEQSIAKVLGTHVPVTLVVDSSAGDDPHHDEPLPTAAGRNDAPRAATGGGQRGADGSVAPVVELHPGGVPTPDEDIDLDDLVDAPPESVITPIERLAQAFPGSELLDERR